MGKKKRGVGGPTSQQAKPFCYYCDRTFEDETILLQHQRAKHFKCQECDDNAIRGKCESVQGLILHTLKVHSKSLAKVPNAMQGREHPELSVYGMDGVPADVLEARGFTPSEPIGDAPPVPAAPAPMELPMPPLPAPTMELPPLPAPGPGLAPSLEGFQQFLAASAVPQTLEAPPLPNPGLAPSLGGFQQFLASQAASGTVTAPGMLPLTMPTGQLTAPTVPPMSMPAGQAGAPTVPHMALPGGQVAPPPVPPMSMPAGQVAATTLPPIHIPTGQVTATGVPPALPPQVGGAPPPVMSAPVDIQVDAAAGLKRRRDDETGEDVSVEELRAKLDRYAFPKCPGEKVLAY